MLLNTTTKIKCTDLLSNCNRRNSITEYNTYYRGLPSNVISYNLLEVRKTQSNNSSNGLNSIDRISYRTCSRRPVPNITVYKHKLYNIL